MNDPPARRERPKTARRPVRPKTAVRKSGLRENVDDLDDNEVSKIIKSIFISYDGRLLVYICSINKLLIINY